MDECYKLFLQSIVGLYTLFPRPGVYFQTIYLDIHYFYHFLNWNDANKNLRNSQTIPIQTRFRLILFGNCSTKTNCFHKILIFCSRKFQFSCLCRLLCFARQGQCSAAICVMIKYTMPKIMTGLKLFSHHYNINLSNKPPQCFDLYHIV